MRGRVSSVGGERVKGEGRGPWWKGVWGWEEEEGLGGGIRGREGRQRGSVGG